MFAVNFYASCFVSRGNLIGKKSIRLAWEKTVYQSLFRLANILLVFKEQPNDYIKEEKKISA